VWVETSNQQSTLGNRAISDGFSGQYSADDSIVNDLFASSLDETAAVFFVVSWLRGHQLPYELPSCCWRLAIPGVTGTAFM
jgi:hypothetical protein